MAKKLKNTYSVLGFYIWTDFSGTSAPSAFREAGKVFGALFILGIVGAFVYLAATHLKAQPLDSISIDTLKTRIRSSWNDSFSRVEALAPSAPMQAGFARFDATAREIEMGQSLPDENGHDSATGQGVSYRALEEKSEGDGFSAKADDNESKGFCNPVYSGTDMFDQVKKRVLDANVNAKEPSRELQKTGGSAIANPMYDLMVDIASEAAKDEKMCSGNEIVYTIFSTKVFLGFHF